MICFGVVKTDNEEGIEEEEDWRGEERIQELAVSGHDLITAASWKFMPHCCPLEKVSLSQTG